MSVCMGCLTNKRVRVGVCVYTGSSCSTGWHWGCRGDTLSLLSLAACTGRCWHCGLATAQGSAGRGGSELLWVVCSRGKGCGVGRGTETSLELSWVKVLGFCCSRVPVCDPRQGGEHLVWEGTGGEGRCPQKAGRGWKHTRSLVLSHQRAHGWCPSPGRAGPGHTGHNAIAVPSGLGWTVILWNQLSGTSQPAGACPCIPCASG